MALSNIAERGGISARRRRRDDNLRASGAADGKVEQESIPTKGDAVPGTHAVDMHLQRRLAAVGHASGVAGVERETHNVASRHELDAAVGLGAGAGSSACIEGVDVEPDAARGIICQLLECGIIDAKQLLRGCVPPVV